MTRKSRSFAIALLAATTALSPLAQAATSGTAASPSTQNASNNAPSAGDPASGAEANAIQRDFTKLSHDGFTAFRDIRMARLAIFDGRTDAAGTLVEKASDALDTARGDETSFRKDLAEIHPPAGAQNPHGAMSGGGSANADEKASQEAEGGSAPAGQPTEWLPIDGQISLAEGYQVTSDNAAPVEAANQALRSGDRQTAVEHLKLAGVDLRYVLALAPLETTLSKVDQAAADMKDGKFYEANLALKAAEDAIVFDAMEVTGLPADQAAEGGTVSQGAAPQSGAQGQQAARGGSEASSSAQ